LSVIEHNKSLKINDTPKYKEINLRYGMPNQIIMQRIALSFIVYYYKFMLAVLESDVFGGNENLNNFHFVLKKLTPQMNKLHSICDEYFVVHYIINELVEHFIKVNHSIIQNEEYDTAKKITITENDIDNLQINSAIEAIENPYVKKSIVKYVKQHQNSLTGNLGKYVNAMIQFGLCVLKGNNYIDPPVLIMLNLLKIIKQQDTPITMVNYVQKCMGDLKTLDKKMFTDIINKKIDISIPELSEHLSEIREPISTHYTIPKENNEIYPQFDNTFVPIQSPEHHIVSKKSHCNICAVCDFFDMDKVFTPICKLPHRLVKCHSNAIFLHPSFVKTLTHSFVVS
jgi:hypothetical protein